ncbi:DUF2332 domain-containing protein [Amycolatopsis sp. NPDC051903]|uniref:DUF2332 domain-containing protein n=1 Tax=Amycolatopsis sp. NPDC051903 TaxID=3363936 RepID=UPI0037BCFC1A
MTEGTDRSVGVDRIRRLFRVFSATQGQGGSPVYAALSDGVVTDDGLLDLLLAAPGEQRRPSLLFAAVNLLLAAEPGAPLAAYYPIHGGSRAIDDRLVPAFAAFCDGHRDELLRLLRERSTQTNDIRRCVALRLGLDHVRRRWPGPLALVEVGASAGLNLRFDRYRYRLNGHETAGPSPVVVSCEVHGELPAEPPPEITTRLGLDLNPIDLTDPDARAWLAAFIWPEQVGELATLRGAIDVALALPAPVVRGNAVTDTGQTLAELPGSEPVVVFTASLLSYLTADERTAFADQLRASRRPVAWVFAEAPGLLAATGLTVPTPLARRTTNYVVGASLPDHDELLALADPYLRWLAPARHAADDFTWV